MIVLRCGSLVAALLLAAAAGAPASILAQDREPLVRALDIVGRGAQIGVTVTEIEGEDAKQPKTGVLVETVTPGGPADKAGIKAGDAITEFDGERVRSTMQFSRLVQETAPGRSVGATVSRGGQRLTMTVTPEHRSWSDDFNMRLLDLPRAARAPTPPVPPRAVRPPAPPDMDSRFELPLLMRLSGRRLGITIESIDDQLAEYFGVKEGVLVKSVADGSAAQKAGLKAGDVITSVNGTKVYDASDVNRAMDRLETDGQFTVDVVRDKKPQTLKGKLETRETRPRARVRTIL